jgi:hypothetical protein
MRFFKRKAEPDTQQIRDLQIDARIEMIRERITRRKKAFEDGAVIKRQLGNISPSERDARVAQVLGWILCEIDEVMK